MATEYDRLISYFDADTSGLKSAAAQVDSIISKIEARFKNLKSNISLKFTQSGGFDESKITAGLSGVEAKVRSFSTSFNQSIKNLSTDGLTRSANSLNKEFDAAISKGATYENTLRQFTPEINKLAASLKKGSADQSDYNNRLAQLPPEMQKAIAQTRNFGKEIVESGAKIKNSSLFSGSFKGGFLGALLGGVLPQAISEIKQLTVDGVKMNASLDKLVRFTATLDKNFQTPVGIRTLQEDFKKLSTEIPQSAENIAKASFTIKSAFQNITEPELIDFLRQFGLAATASNTDIASHAENVAALAKQYGITAKELPKFNAMIASSFGQALASDSAVASGFNEVVNAAKSTKQPLDVLIASMSTLQGQSNNAAENTTLLKNSLEKLADPKYIEGFKSIGISVFDAKGQFKDIGIIINEVAEKMKGLTDEQVAKKFDFLKDIRAREGFLTLARNVQAYNDQLRNGADTESFKNKTSTMLDATENRWARFWATITNAQTGVGGTISDKLLSAFDSTTFLGGLDIFVTKTSGAVQSGLIKIFAAGRIQAEALKGSSDEDIAKLTDYYAGITNAIDENVNKQQLDVLVNQRQFWQKLADNTASPKVKTDALANVDSLNKSINSALNAGALDQYDAWKKIADQAALGLKSGDVEAVQAAKESIQKVSSALVQAMADPRLSDGAKADFRKLYESLPAIAGAAITAGKPEVDAAVQNLVTTNVDTSKTANLLGTSFWQNAVTGILAGKTPVQTAIFSMINTANIAAQANAQGRKIGADLGGGLLQGMNSKLGEIRTLSMLMGSTAESGLRTQLQTQSPSKVFFAIGKDVVQGFIDGINALKVSAQSTVAGILDISELNIPFSKKTDAEGVGLLSSLIGEISKFNVTTKEAEVLLELTAGKYEKLNFEIRNRIILAAQEIDLQKKITEGIDSIFNAVSEFTKKETSFTTMLDLFADPKYTAQIEARAKALGMTADELKRLVEIQAASANLKTPFDSSTIEPKGRPVEDDPFGGIKNDVVDIFADSALKVKVPWEDFFGTFLNRVRQIKASLPSLKASIGENLLGSLSRISDIFASSLSSWDGSLKGFFSSILQGLKGFVQQVLSEITRLLVMKAVTAIIGAIGGGIGGGAAGPGVSGTNGGTFGGGVIGTAHGFASGGMPPIGQMSLVGERGPELFIPKTAGTIITNEKTKEMLSGGASGDKINVVINQNFRGQRQLTAPKSQRQAAAGAASGISQGLRGRR